MNTPLDTQTLKKLADELDAARKSLTEARSDYSKAKSICKPGDQFGSGTQANISVSIGDRRVTLTTYNSSYSATLIRGFEMIYLGVLKVLDAAIDRHAARVADLETQIANAARVQP